MKKKKAKVIPESRPVTIRAYYEVNDSQQPLDELNFIFEQLKELGIATFTSENPIVKRKSKDKQLQSRSFVASRKQSNFEKIEELVGNRSVPSIVMIENDLFSGTLNWCFGAFSPASNCLIVSIHRIKNLFMFRDLLFHEMGHMLGACSDGRSNTTESLGSHCTNDLCVMKQSLTVNDALEHTKKRYKAKVQPYCDQCLEEMKNQK